jgi:hypothetical protein
MPDPTDPVSPADAALLDDLARIINGAADAWEPAGHVPCLFTMPLDSDGRVEWCRIDAGRPHHIHVSTSGVYRWDDNGTVVPTPHIASPAFDQLYRDDPEGQKPWQPTQGGQNLYNGGAGLYHPPEGVTGLQAFVWRWNAYATLPALQRRTRRAALAAGFSTSLIVAVAFLSAVILAALVVLWVALSWMVAYLAP